MMKNIMMHRCIFLLSCLCFIFPLCTIYGKENTLSGFYWFQKIYQENKTEGKVFLLFCDAQIKGYHTGNVYIIKGTTQVIGTVEGNIYIYDGQLNIDSEAQILGSVHALLGNVHKQPKALVQQGIHPLIPSFPLLIKALPIPEFLKEKEELPRVIVLMVQILLQILIGLILISLGKNFVEQGNMILYYQPYQVFREGGILFFMFSLLIGLFTLSLIGFPIALFFLLFLWLFSLLGQIIIGIFIGWSVEKKVALEWHIYIYYLLGTAILEVFKAIPALGCILRVIIIPWISLGILSRQYINKKIDHKVFKTIQHQERVGANHKELYTIITKGIGNKKREDEKP